MYCRARFLKLGIAYDVIRSADALSNSREIFSGSRCTAFELWRWMEDPGYLRGRHTGNGVLLKCIGCVRRRPLASQRSVGWAQPNTAVFL